MIIFSPTLMQTFTYIFILIISLVETFGLIIMVNQRLNTEMKEAKNHFEAIFNTNPDAILISRLNDGVIVNGNEGFTALTGFTHAEVIGESSLDVNIWYHPADRQKLITELGMNGFCENMEAHFQRKDGSQLTGSLSAKIIFLQGAPHSISVTRDITDRKQAEEEKGKADARLRTLSAAIEQSPVTTVITDLEGNIVFVNPKFAETTGYTAEEAIGKKPQDIKNRKHAEFRV
jgi:PAS domain S-box-containing protein